MTPEEPGRHGPVQDTLLRALGVLRVVVLLNSVALYAVRSDGYARPLVGWLVVAALALWTGVALWAYGRPAWRRAPLLVTDLAVGLAAILLTPYVKGDGFSATLPGFWVMSVVLAWAVVWRGRGGLVAAAAVSLADLWIRPDLTQSDYGNIFLLLLGGAVVGFLSRLLQQTAAQRDRAERAAAVAGERQRLARVVHDGVLQVLALVQRRGPELGPEGMELGRLAGEQEVRLRGLVQTGSRDLVAPLGERDLARLLAELQSAQVQVVVPGTPAVLPAEVADEVLAAVEACLSNVRHHVGHDAPAWVLLEELADALVVTVRDEGPGIAAGRLEESAAQGRLGVRQSVVGRLHDLGGQATLRTVPGEGTEWELRVPRPPAGRGRA